MRPKSPELVESPSFIELPLGEGNVPFKEYLAALEEVGLVAEGYAKRACPVDTGRLRNSITHIVDEDGKCAVIGTNVEYASYVELGTRHQKPQPYLKPAAEDHESTYRSIFRKHLGG